MSTKNRKPDYTKVSKGDMEFKEVTEQPVTLEPCRGENNPNANDPFHFEFGYAQRSQEIQLRSCTFLNIQPGTRAVIKTNVKITMPEGVLGLIVPDLEATYHRGLTYNVQIVNSGEEIVAYVHNISRRSITVSEGQTIGKLIFFTPRWVLVEVPEPAPKPRRPEPSQSVVDEEDVEPLEEA